jgi:hypothetical protein
MKANEYRDNKALFVLLKSEPGCGKSIAASSWLEKGPMYFFDFDGKIKAVINFWKKRNPSFLDKLEFDHFETYNEAVEKLESFIKDGHPYTGGIVWDTLTTSVDSLLVQVTDVKGGGNKKVGGISVNEIEDYNAESSGLTRLVQHSKFKLHKIHNTNFFMLAHVVRTEEKNLKTQGVTVSRSLVTAGKKVAAKLPGYFDEIWHAYCDKDMNSGNVRYMITTQNVGDDFARTSCDLPKLMDVTYPKTLYQIINGELNVTPLK